MAKFVVELIETNDYRKFLFESDWYNDSLPKIEDGTGNENIFNYIRRIGNMWGEDNGAYHTNDRIMVNGEEVWNGTYGFMLSDDWLKAELAFNIKNS